MTQEAQNYVEWCPEYDGHAPPNWRDGMHVIGFRTECMSIWHKPVTEPFWGVSFIYLVPTEALTAPNEDVVPDGWSVSGALSIIRAMSPDELAKHGITLAPERDWATELWAETFEIFGRSVEAKLIRRGTTRDERDKEVISLFRTRFEQMKGEG